VGVKFLRLRFLIVFSGIENGAQNLVDKWVNPVVDFIPKWCRKPDWKNGFFFGRPIVKELSTLVNFVSLHHKSFLDSNLTVGVFGRGFGGALAVLNTVALAANPKVTRLTLYTEECSRVLAEDGTAFFELLCKTPIVNEVMQTADVSSPEQRRRPMSRICVVDWTSRWESFSTRGGLKPHVQPVVLQTDCPARTAGSWAPFVKGYQKAFTSYVGKPSTAASALLETTTSAAAQVLHATEVKLVGQAVTTTLPITVTVPAKAKSKKQALKTHVERIPAIVTWVTVGAKDSALTAIVEYTCTWRETTRLRPCPKPS
jgi:hypothetical protein